MIFKNFTKEWFSNVPKDLLAGIVVALALIPEAIAFSIIAGVDPKVGLYASFCIAVVSAFLGGRPGMISAATGAMALLMITLVREHGLQYLFAATLLTGFFQILAGWFKLGDALKFVSRSVMTGFVNALAILIFMAQLPEFRNTGWTMYAMVAGGLAIIYIVPRFTKAIPSPLICIVVLTAISLLTGMGLRTVGDMGELPSTLPVFLFPQIPWNWETLAIILPYAIPLTVVGLLESLMTATIVDDLTDTESNKNRECMGQGASNIVSGFFGGMAGCAMIGQTVINVKSGGRGRLSTFVAGAFLLVLIVVCGTWVKVIPMAALVAVMIMVSVATFNWHSIAPSTLKKMPKSETAVMVTTVVVTVWTHNLALGVIAGVVVAMVAFARRVAHFVSVTRTLSVEDEGPTAHYVVDGELFFASSNDLTTQFEYSQDPELINIDMSASHIWDASTVAAIDAIVTKYENYGKKVTLTGMNEATTALHGKLSGGLGEGV